MSGPLVNGFGVGVYWRGMETTKRRTGTQRIHQRTTDRTRLAALLRREGLTLGDVRRLLLPSDPWVGTRGMWTGRRARAERAQRKLRKEWDRT